MKKFVMAVAMMFVASYAHAATFAYVDLMKVFNEYSKTVKYDEELAKAQSAKEAGLKTKNEAVVKMQDEAKLLKADAKKAKDAEIAKLGGQLQEEYKASLEELRGLRDTKMQEVLKDIEDAITVYAKANNIDYVFKKAALAFGNESMDKTAEIIKALNK
jgi:Skp family chaperone for outer membrane proteins